MPLEWLVVEQPIAIHTSSIYHFFALILLYLPESHSGFLVDKYFLLRTSFCTTTQYHEFHYISVYKCAYIDMKSSSISRNLKNCVHVHTTTKITKLF